MSEEIEGYCRMREVLAEEILREILQGEKVEYENANIIGSLNLYEINLPKDENEKIIIRSEISISDSKIEGKIDFRGGDIP